MRSRTRLAFIGLTFLIISTLLVGCGSSTLKIGWRETSGLKRKRASYTTFDGVQRKTFRAQTGQAIELACDVTVEKGTLTVKLTAPDGDDLWEETFEESREAFFHTTATEDGLYILRIEGEKTGGGFDISWNVKE
jgi:hypothetical protein